eukprot:365555-Chlamydomonas_euryale.AAC.13
MTTRVAEGVQRDAATLPCPASARRSRKQQQHHLSLFPFLPHTLLGSTVRQNSEPPAHPAPHLRSLLVLGRPVVLTVGDGRALTQQQLRRGAQQGGAGGGIACPPLTCMRSAHGSVRAASPSPRGS